MDDDHIKHVLKRPISERLNGWVSGIYHTISIIAALIGLVVWTVRQEAHLNELDHEVSKLSAHVDDLELHGTRALSERVGIIQLQLSNLDTREARADIDLGNAIADRSRQDNERITILSNRLSEWESTLRKVDVIETRQTDALRRFDQLLQRLDDGRPAQIDRPYSNGNKR